MGRTHHAITAAAAIALAVWLGLNAGGGSGLFAPVAAYARAQAASGDTLATRKAQLLIYERSFRPSTYDGPLRSLPSPADTAAETPAFSSRATYAAPETLQGFRIQVMNTNSYDESSAMRNALLAAFDTWWVYVVYDAPTYKVRIGDFATRLEAKNALEQIQAKGFNNAWLVPDKVVLHLPPRMPLAAPIDSSAVK